MSRRKPDPIESWSGSLQSVVTDLAKRTEKRGGDLVVAVTNLARPEHESSLEAIADILAEAGRATIFVPVQVEPGVYRYEVNYDETLAEKLATKDTVRIGWVADIATDDRYPDDRKGKKVVTGRIVHFNRSMSQEAIERWCEENVKTLGRPRELVDLAKAFPRPALDEYMPLAAPGQFWRGPDDFRNALCLRRVSAERCLDDVWLSPDEGWDDRWRFLVLDK